MACPCLYSKTLSSPSSTGSPLSASGYRPASKAQKITDDRFAQSKSSRRMHLLQPYFAWTNLAEDICLAGQRWPHLLKEISGAAAHHEQHIIPAAACIAMAYLELRIRCRQVWLQPLVEKQLCNHPVPGACCCDVWRTPRHQLSFLLYLADTYCGGSMHGHIQCNTALHAYNVPVA